jgi:hypothetical protein
MLAMAQLNVEATDDPLAIEAIEEEILTPAQRLHRRYNEISAHVDGLKRLIEIRKALGEDFSRLWKRLQEAETKKRDAHAELAEVGRSKILSRCRSGAAQ